MRSLVLSGSLAVFLMSLVAVQAQAETGEEMLKTKGIKRVGTYLAMAEEVSLSKMFGEVTKLKKSMTDAEKEMAAVDKKVDDAKLLRTNYLQQWRQLNAALPNATSVTQNNQIVTAMNELLARIKLLEETDFSKEQKAARDKVYQAREAYLQHVVNMRTLADKISRSYLELAENSEVKQAIEQLNKETGKEYKLTESTAFQAHQRNLKKLEDSVLSESIPIRTDGSDTYYVSATLNGKYAKELCVDSGSSLVCLPYKMAKEVGSEPEGSAPTLTLVLADGREVEAKQVILPSIRVGKFTIENVECAVMPENLPNASPLLGMSFLRNFSFKIEAESSKLTMTQVESKGSK